MYAPQGVEPSSTKRSNALRSGTKRIYIFATFFFFFFLLIVRPPHFAFAGVLSKGDPPLPIPNREVKALGPDDTRTKPSPGKVGYAGIRKMRRFSFS